MLQLKNDIIRDKTADSVLEKSKEFYSVKAKSIILSLVLVNN